MSLWDDEDFREKHEGEWKEYAYYDIYGWPEPEDDVGDLLEPTTEALLDAIEHASPEFCDCLMFTQIYDYLVAMYEFFNNRKRVMLEPQEGLSDVEYAKSICDLLPEFIAAVDDTLDDAPRFSKEFALEDIKIYADEGMEELQTIIDNGGLD
jgi:hypothetical protein